MIKTCVPFIVSILLISSCSLFKVSDQERGGHVRTEAERKTGYTYVPMDPFPILLSDACSLDYSDNSQVLKLFPDNAVRMSIESFDSSGSIAYGPVGIGVAGQLYKVVIDYINVDTTSATVFITKYCYDDERNAITEQLDNECPYDYQSGVTYTVEGDREGQPRSILTSRGYSIPVYVGVGLRVSADVLVQEGAVNISGLGAIGAEAEANRLRGSLVVQTIGINGRSISAALPIQSELNRSTTQDAIVAVGSIKALLYDEDTQIAPRVVGLYLPFPADRPLVNEIISHLSHTPPRWSPNCAK